MKGVDLDLFQFNWNVMFFAVFLNADGLIYGRYGGPSIKSLSTAAFKRTLERVLAAHATGDPKPFEGKRGKPLAWKTPEKMPSLGERFKNADAPKSCIHCHHVWTGLITSTVADGAPMPAEFVWPYPRPQSLGLTLDADDPTRIEAVAEGSVAGTAGARKGDTLIRAGGQAILTEQDLEWVLHHLPAAGAVLDLIVQRGDEKISLQLNLKNGWRRVARRPLFGVVGLGMKLTKLSEAERKDAGIAKETMALRVANIGKGSPSFAAGFRPNDLIVGVDERKDDWEDDELIWHIRSNRKKGDTLRIDVLRAGKTLVIDLPIR